MDVPRRLNILLFAYILRSAYRRLKSFSEITRLVTVRWSSTPPVPRIPVPRPSAGHWFPVLSPFGTDRSLRALEDWWVGKKLRRYLCGSIESGQASEINRLPDSSTQLNKKIQQTMGVTTEEGPGPRSSHSGWDLSEICAKSQNRWVVGGTTISVLLVKNFSTWTHEN